MTPVVRSPKVREESGHRLGGRARWKLPYELHLLFVFQCVCKLRQCLLNVLGFWHTFQNLGDVA